MGDNSRSPRFVHFGDCTLELDTAELRRNGTKVTLQEQPFQILTALLENPGQLVPRDELIKRLWPTGTFVDFDQSLNKAVARLREALGDGAEQPRYIETLPRRGYRFIAPCFSDIAKQDRTNARKPPLVVPPDSWRRGWQGTLVLSILFGVCLLAATWASVRWHWNNSAIPILKPIPFTALPGDATLPSLSPDGSQVVFSWTGDPAKTKGVDLYVKKVGSEEVRRLTKHSFDFVTSAWSPDGSNIAFQGSSKNESGLYIIKADGSREKKVRSTFPISQTALSNLAWSPDGKTIAFVDAPIEDGRMRLELLFLGTLQVSQVEPDDRCQYEAMPAFSHDGKQLAYECFIASGNFALSVAGPHGQSPRIIKEFDGYTLGMSWSGDNKRLIFSHFQQSHGHDRLREISVGDGTVRDLRFGAGASPRDLPVDKDALWPNIAASGVRLAFGMETAGSNVTVWRADLRDLHSSPIKLIASTRSQSCAQYSPDGKHIAFASNRGGRTELWMSDSEGRNLVELSHSENFQVGAPNWSPDSRRVVFDGWADGHPQLYVVDIVERIPRKLNIGGQEGSVPDWSHDGRWVYFVAGGGPRGGRIYRVSAEGGEPQAITSALGYAPKDSEDGRGIYFVAMPKTLEFATINPTGTEYKTEGMPPLSFHGNWTVVRDGIYFFPEDAPKTLSYFNFATKQVRPVLTVENYAPFGLSVSPDGLYLLFTQLEDLHSDIMIVDNFK
jgi:Tol biopolymer transport system component/DNA-binding winged helix-turn-helix (wHTH) protein